MERSGFFFGHYRVGHESMNVAPSHAVQIHRDEPVLVLLPHTTPAMVSLVSCFTLLKGSVARNALYSR